MEDDDEGGEVVRAHHAFLEEGEEDGRAEVGRDGTRHRQVGTRDEPPQERRHGVATEAVVSSEWPPEVKSDLRVLGTSDETASIKGSNQA